MSDPYTEARDLSGHASWYFGWIDPEATGAAYAIHRLSNAKYCRVTDRSN